KGKQFLEYKIRINIRFGTPPEIIGYSRCTVFHFSFGAGMNGRCYKRNSTVSFKKIAKDCTPAHGGHILSIVDQQKGGYTLSIQKAGQIGVYLHFPLKKN